MKSHKFIEEVLCKVRGIENTLKVLRKSELNIEDKIEQICLLEEIKHEIISHDIIKESLIEINAFGRKRISDNRKLKLMERMYKSNSAIPVDLIKSLSQAKVECQNLWKISQYEVKNLKKLKKHFTNMINLLREVVSIKSHQLKCSQYDSLLAEYDFDITEKNIKEIFPKVGKFFCESVSSIIEKQEKNNFFNIHRVSIQKQIEFGSLFLQKTGIKLYHTSYYHQVDYDESDFRYSLFFLLRCIGYEIYRKHLAQSPIKNRIIEYVIYEAQGLFMEKIIGKSKEFIEFINPYIEQKFFINNNNTINNKFTSCEKLYLFFNKINFSSLLKNADELSLLAHIMLRTKLEQNIINGKLEVIDLHDAWLEGMEYYKIPVKAKNELDTYFQDEYWVNGIIGYFPIKIIGLIIATQIFSFIKKDHYDFLSSIIKGDFSKLIGWLSQNMCSTTKYGFLGLLKKITGKGLDIECLTNYLSEKYNLF